MAFEEGAEVRTVVVASTPEGVPVAENFALGTEAAPAVAAGQIGVRVDVLSMDPFLRSLLTSAGHMGDAPPWAPAR